MNFERLLHLNIPPKMVYRSTYLMGSVAVVAFVLFWIGFDDKRSYNIGDGLQNDFENYVDKVMTEQGYSTREEAYKYIEKWLNIDADDKNGISDFIKEVFPTAYDEFHQMLLDDLG